jgi:hypothetical protein
MKSVTPRNIHGSPSMYGTRTSRKNPLAVLADRRGQLLVPALFPLDEWLCGITEHGGLSLGGWQDDGGVERHGLDPAVARADGVAAASGGREDR